MASVESVDKVFFINASSVEFGDVIGKGGFAYQVYSASLTLPLGEVRKAAAKKVGSVENKEVEVMKKLNHKNIIGFYGVLVDNLDTYIIMELAENGDLRKYLDEFRNENKMRLPPEIVQKWVYEAACGLCYLHETHQSHRDIKSLNYLITKDFTLKLGDLGLAKELDLTQTTTGMRGTCRWMAPEVIMKQIRSVKSDVFSYGTVVWEICTTDIPFADKRGEFQVMNAVCSGKRPPIPDDCPQHLKKLIETCWLVDYNMRPDMSEICNGLEQCKHGVQGEQTTDELSHQLQQTAIDDEHMDTMTEQPQADTADPVPCIVTDCADLSQVCVELPSVKQLSGRKGLSSSEYIDCDSGPAGSGSIVMYKMCDVPRGVCLIINNMDFSQTRNQGHNLLYDRQESDADSKKLLDIFTKFKFNVEYKTNLSSEEMNRCFDEIRCQDHTSANAFVCCILTHGQNGHLAGCEGKYITVQNVINNFTKEKCPSLAKKPKMFFIQSCIGVESQEVLQAGGGTPASTDVSPGLTQLRSERDFLISHASIPEPSQDHSKRRSPYVSVLVDKLNELHEEEDLKVILTKVNNQLNEEPTKPLGELCTLPVNNLRKKVYFTMWENKPPRSITHATCEVDFQGGDLTLPEIGVRLKVPEGALPKDISVVNMSLSLHQDPDDHPPIDADHLMITPIICCGPEGVEFNKPVMLVLPHSVPSFKDFDFTSSNGQDIHLWFKSSKDDWQKLPSKIPDGKNQPFWLKEITQNTIVLEMEHFCKFGLSASKQETMTILMFMQPSRIMADTSAVYVYAYAVQESLAEVVREKEKNSNASIMCAKETPLTLLPNQKQLGITLKKVKPMTGWIPTSTNNSIGYKTLQRGNERSRCEFCFEKISQENPTTIRGQYDAKQDENEEDIITNFHFDISMFRTTCYGAHQTTSVVTASGPAQDSDLVNSLQLMIPKKETVQERIEQSQQWRQLLHRTEVRDMLLPILTENMLDYFRSLHTNDKQHITNAYKNKTQLDAAEIFLTKISRLGNDEWHRELIEALARSGCTGCCQFLGEVYQKCLQATEHSKDETVFCPPNPKRVKVEYSKTKSTHLSIWSDVVQSEISNLCTSLNPENFLKVIEKYIPGFVTQNQSEFQTTKGSLGVNRAFRSLLESLSKCGDPGWPRALEMAIEGNPIQDAIHESFWVIHSQEKYSSCPCEGEKKSEGTQASLEGES